MEIKDLILLIWRNLKYIILGLVLGAGVGIAASKIQSPVYEASTKVFISRTRQQGSSDLLSLSDEQLLAINLQLAKSPSVLNDVSAQLGSKVDADNILVGALANTLIIQIKVQDNDPQRAAMIANLLVKTLIQKNESLLSDQYAGLETTLTEQLGQVQKQIDELQTQISQINGTDIQGQLTEVSQQIDKLKADTSGLEQEIAAFPDYLTPLDRISLAEKQAQLDQLHSLMTIYQQIQTNLTYIGKPGQNGSSLVNPRLVTLQSTLDLYQQINTTLINNRETARLARTQSRQNVMQIVSATPPKNPVRPIPALYTLLGGAVGLILVAIAVLMIDHMDESLKSAGQIEKLLNLPVLGIVFENSHAKKGLVTAYDPLSAETESFRSLGVSLEIVGKSGAGKNVCTLMVVNAEPKDARTNIAANLAIINAQQGKQVILLDADLKRPHIHSLFGMENQKGFAELLNDKIDIKSVCHDVKSVDGLTLISSGIVNTDSLGWLDTEKLSRLFATLKKQADLVIVDGPPADVADAQVLASKMDSVLLTIRAGHTRADSAQATLKRFQLIGARVTGVVLNRTAQHRRPNKRFLDWLKIKPDKKERPDEVKNEIDAPAIPQP